MAMKRKNYTTSFLTIDPAAGVTQATSQAFGSASVSKKRGVIDRRFAGAIVCAKDDNSATSVAKIYHSIASVSYLMDSVSLSPGESAVWTEEDYGIVLKKTDYIKIVISGDDANCWITTYDTYH